MNRELLAYALIAGIVIVILAFAIAYLRRRKHEKLRQRGIKRHGH